MGRERDDAPPELAAWVGGQRQWAASARTAELLLGITAAGVREPGGRAAAVARACEAAGFVMPEPEPKPAEVPVRQTRRRRG